MRDVFVLSDNIVSPLGGSTEENFRALASGRTGIRLHERVDMSRTPFYASLFDSPIGFEELAVASASAALVESGLDPSDPRLVFILSSTKGNIGLLERGVDDPSVFSLASSASRIAARLGFVTPPLVVSHACISGVEAMITARRLLRAGRFDHAVVAGADLITRFILSGFQSFQAVSPEPCRPFDAGRQGVTLGEAAGTVVLSVRAGGIRLAGGAVSNDANHISGPSRTGEELYMAIRRALPGGSVDFISAHGTATLYNDDMEARALTLAGLAGVPVNSLKGFYGHTLGAAGLVESIISMQSLRENLILGTPGYRSPGTVVPLRVAAAPIHLPVQRCLKTASGFGGCNAALILEKTI
ncbi:beta-ketoacyl synthase N-terminal-like domain-containing protein [Dinghuibacter silviterrae]|uniref:3-oxoacyl-[acyl-carrier-protein] synthase-1 n=1 Tax=Dinghuibacter silviterrae TaxID=1539049 RepID=A0A4R8DV51_9BACT|nr:beta-ketoacyl synthase N-terminal-like domain-containing protein [Dinghuibacter silviterrae]TDX02284.1 3-oxoacyl-[acyl-carrier-protein] synthase-1 [Dinghuibacter silviterrae]